MSYNFGTQTLDQVIGEFWERYRFTPAHVLVLPSGEWLWIDDEGFDQEGKQWAAVIGGKR